jgi:hypothetical protein
MKRAALGPGEKAKDCLKAAVQELLLCQQEVFAIPSVKPELINARIKCVLSELRSLNMALNKLIKKYEAGSENS